MTTIDVEERIATIRAALDELRADDALDGMIILELEDILDRLRNLVEQEPFQPPPTKKRYLYTGKG